MVHTVQALLVSKRELFLQAASNISVEVAEADWAGQRVEANTTR